MTTAFSGLRPMRTVWPGSKVYVWPAAVILSSLTGLPPCAARYRPHCRGGRALRLPISRRWFGHNPCAARDARRLDAGGLGDHGVHLRFARGELGGVLLLVDPLGQVLVGPHQHLKVAVRGSEDPEVGERV